MQGDGSYDLVIDNLLDKAVDAIAALFGDSSQSLGALVNAQGGEMRIKDFIPANLHGNFAVSYFGEQQSELNGLGKLNMVFKKANPLTSVQTLKISAIENAIAGALSANPLIDAAYTAAAVATRFAKGMAWSQEVDPLVLDLDGDGLETTDITAAAVHFDINGDLFAERTGWLGAREGFLALDRNGNGRIDNGSELFGTASGAGFSDLAVYDSIANGGNGDGKISAADAVWAQLRVWQDANQDGVSAGGELHTLADEGIVSIALNALALNGNTPQGANLRAAAAFTRADGTRGTIYEAIFQANHTDTVYAGEAGRAAANDNDNSAWREAAFCLDDGWEIAA